MATTTATIIQSPGVVPVAAEEDLLALEREMEEHVPESDIYGSSIDIWGSNLYGYPVYRISAINSGASGSPVQLPLKKS